MKRRDLTFAEWEEEAARKFGEDRMQWKFVCPSCDHAATVEDWKNVGAAEGEVAFSCVGRHTGADDKNTFSHNGGPCTYVGGGLICLNPVQVTFPNGKKVSVFEFAKG